MIEEKLSSKMSEFMTALDQVQRYRKLISAMTDFTIIIITSVAVLLFLHISVNLMNLYGVGFFSSINWFIPLSDVIIICFGVFLGVVWVGRQVGTVKTREWANTLNEGPSGALKLLSEINWENIFNDMRFAKLGFAFYGIMKLLAYWLIAVFLYVVLYGSLVVNFLHFSFNIISTLVMPFAFVLILSMKDLHNRYEQVGRLDSLLWELRWFEKEFTGTDFQA